jgi:hypothetical protein
VCVEQISGEVCSTNVPRLGLSLGRFRFRGRFRQPAVNSYALDRSSLAASAFKG